MSQHPVQSLAAQGDSLCVADSAIRSVAMWPRLREGLEPTGANGSRAADGMALRVAAVAALVLAAPGVQGQDAGLNRLEEPFEPDGRATPSAAVFVLTGEEVKRSGAGNLPEALRFVPGVQVAQLDSRQWAVSIRGFNARIARKVSVVVDGRPVYDSLFGSVPWDVPQVLLEDVERVEVVRGPGLPSAGVYGVSGVISVETLPAEQTAGGLVRVETGTERQVSGAVRYGFQGGEDVYARAYVQYEIHDDTALSGGDDNDDPWNLGEAGLRVDWRPWDLTRLEFHAGAHAGSFSQTYYYPDFRLPPDYVAVDREGGLVNGGYVTGKWARELSAESELSLQFSYLRWFRESAEYEETHDVFDFDFRHVWQAHEQAQLRWGMNYRFDADSIDPGVARDDFLTNEPSTVAFYAPNNEAEIDRIGGFVEGDWEMVPERIVLTAGTRLDYFESTGFEVQPTVRLAWLAAERHRLWTAFSRSVRPVTRAENSAVFDLDVLPSTSQFEGMRVVRTSGVPDLDAETLLSAELGYVFQPAAALRLEAVTFYQQWDELIAGATNMVDLSPPEDLAPYLIRPVPYANAVAGDVYGVEAAAVWEPARAWRFSGGYTFLESNLDPIVPRVNPRDVGWSPSHQAYLRVGWEPVAWLVLDVNGRYVGALEGAGIDAYGALDARVAWKPAPAWELAVVGRNLTDARHAEIPQQILGPTAEIERSVSGRVTVRF